MKQLIEQLRPSEVIDNFVDKNKDWSQMRARQIGVMSKYVTIQTLLHLPYYCESSIINDEDVLSEVDTKIIQLCKSYKATYDRLYDDSHLSILSSEAILKGRKELTICDGPDNIPAIFDRVASDMAYEINNSLHYIRSARFDTLQNYGLYLDKANSPYACVSFSQCKRGYQISALNEVTGLNLAPDEVLSMTRAFTFNNSPHNSMSKLFHLSHERIKKDYPNVRSIITALNPYIGFDGGIFTGSSYTSYALSPMEYWYNEEGYYVPRSSGVQLQKTATPPIIWLAHGIDKNSAQAIDRVLIDNIKHITPMEYREG